MDEDTDDAEFDRLMRAETKGSGQSVNIVLGSDALKPFAWFAGTVLAVALLISILSLAMSIYGLTTANDLSRKFDNLEREARLQAYWAQRAEVAMDKYGIAVPRAPQVSPRKDKQP